ncbi:spore germination protein GerPE [Bacillus sp. PS06]|uniref:spore germination protein GerPE n=1 Tax=Bacillus sp. PS06 TaxID=2764176 RepID=UPI00177F2B70|nr:spore germination protein GerPE [Bacillus sp. PS06]MBD8067595.1 spore germination protein GerPE [Bacillus sp. PS06]
MFRRLSIVEAIYVNSVSFSSIFEIGDSRYITPVMKALAVKREHPILFTNEGNFNEFSIFTRPIAQVATPEVINMAVFNEKPSINVKTIRVTGVSSSSVVHIGSTNMIRAEARIKHIRQLRRQPDDVPTLQSDELPNNQNQEGHTPSDDQGGN